MERWDEAFRQVAPTGEIPARKSVAALTTGASLLNLDLPWQVIDSTLEQKRGGYTFPIDRQGFEEILTTAHSWISAVKLFHGLVENSKETPATLSDKGPDRGTVLWSFEIQHVDELAVQQRCAEIFTNQTGGRRADESNREMALSTTLAMRHL